ncbi:MAG TPA: hypothetical protein PKD38_07450 [Nitrospira sp.]|nr:hypothetical protein [Nitrospira sp.]
MDSLIKHPEVVVKLVGESGNAFAILGTVKRALRKAKVSEAEIDEFYREATSGDYDNLLRTCAQWVTLE